MQREEIFGITIDQLNLSCFSQDLKLRTHGSAFEIYPGGLDLMLGDIVSSLDGLLQPQEKLATTDDSGKKPIPWRLTRAVDVIS